MDDKKPIVRKSLNTSDGFQCVDISETFPGMYQFQAFRREPEDPRGWRPLSELSRARFPTVEAAIAAAEAQFSWLKNRAD